MASGKAVIGANVGGIPGLITNNVNGFLFEKENIDELADCFRKLFNNKSLAEKMGQQGVKLINKYFSSEIYVSQFSKMAKDVLSEC